MKYHVIYGERGAIIGITPVDVSKEGLRCIPVAETGQKVAKIKLPKELNGITTERIMSRFRVNPKKSCFERIGKQKKKF